MATKRPTYSSWSAIILLVGLAIVTCGGGGAAACGCDWLCPQAASAGTSRSRSVSRRIDFDVGVSGGIVSVDIKPIVWVLLLPASAVMSRGCAAADRIPPNVGPEHRLGSCLPSPVMPQSSLSTRVHMRLNGRIYTFVNACCTAAQARKECMTTLAICRRRRL